MDAVLGIALIAAALAVGWFLIGTRGGETQIIRMFHISHPGTDTLKLDKLILRHNGRIIKRTASETFVEIPVDKVDAFQHAWKSAEMD